VKQFSLRSNFERGTARSRISVRAAKQPQTTLIEIKSDMRLQLSNVVPMKSPSPYQTALAHGAETIE
jgi:hypothetical protein